MLYLDFKDWFLAEMPISNFQLMGNWKPEDRPRGYNQQDIGILTSPKGVEKIHKLWSNTKQNFDMYFLRAPNASKFIEEGEVSPEWVKEKLKIDIQPNPDHITIIYTNNRGAEKVPMTAWTMAHRLGHALMRISGNSRFESDYRSYFSKQVEHDFKNMVRWMFPNQVEKSPYSMFSQENKYNVTPIHLAYMVGTMKSVRDRNLRNFNEFTHELLAQYLITGKIRFNPIDRSILFKKQMAWGRPANQFRYSRIEDDSLNKLNNRLQNMAEEYEDLLDGLMENAIGKIFVM